MTSVSPSAPESRATLSTPPQGGQPENGARTLPKTFEVFPIEGDGYEPLKIETDGALNGELTEPQVMAMLESAQRGIRVENIPLTGSKHEQKDVTVIARSDALGIIEDIYKRLQELLRKKNFGVLEGPEQKGMIGDYLRTMARVGVLDMRFLIGDARIGYQSQQQEKAFDYAKIATRIRLERLGFEIGLGGGIIGFLADGNPENYVEFPRPNTELPKEEQWADVVERAKEVGFVFDEEGRVSGFSGFVGAEGDVIEIPEYDRTD